jgi:GT2 family glycosyltransferase
MNITSSIVIFQTNKDDLLKAISSVVNSPIDMLYIVDNSPHPTEVIRMLSTNPKTEYIFGQGNIGYGAAHNIAIKKAISEGAQYHIVLNPDVEFKSEVIEKMLAYADTHKDTGLMMPKVLFPDGRMQYLCKLLPTPFDWIFRRFIPYLNTVQKRNEKFELRRSGYNKIINVPYLSGCFMFFRVDVLKEIGLFDEKIFMYGEDTDITRRIHQKYQTLFFPDASIIHKFSKKSYNDFRLLCVHIKSAIYYFNKWGWFFDSDRVRINKKVLAEIFDGKGEYKRKI